MVSVAPTSPASHGMTRDILRLLGDVIRAKPWPFAALALILVVGNARTGLYVAALGGLTQALIDRDQQQAITWAAVFLGAGIVEQLYWPFRNHLRTLLLDHATLRIQRRVLTRAADVPLEAFEDGPFFSRLQRANDNLGQHVANAIERVQDVAQVVIMFAAILVPLWLVHPAIVLFLLLGCVPSFVTQYRTARVVHDAVQRHAMTDRLADRLATLLVDRNVGVELRLFGNGPMLMRRWLDARRTIADAVLSAEGTKLRGSLLGEAGIAIGLAGTIFFVVRLLLAERAPIGSWVSVVIGIEWSLQMVAGLAVVTRAVREEGAYLGDLFVFEDTADAISATHRQESPDVASSVVAHSDGAMKIVADHVSFSYPGAGRPVIRDVSLTLSPGERVAIVGENGAGKSTLVRLLTGLYVPDCGKVTQDDVDTASDAAASLRPQIGAVFQDFVAWQLTLRENIGMSALSRIDDDPALRDAAAKAGLLDLVDTLPERLDTWLGREFGDRDLSGGQWQRVALARAFFRDSRLLVMDEPTAALDPLAEQRLFERFAALAHGRTALTISHRLGPARFADRIIVMDAGRIVESGDHDALTAMGGRYARMFKAQSEWYNDHRHTDVPVA